MPKAANIAKGIKYSISFSSFRISVFVVFHYIIIHKIKGHLNAVFDINVRCSRIVIDRRYDAVWVELFYALYYASCTGVAHKAAKRQQHHNTFAAVLQR
jgi:hypothetical protein